MAQQNSLRDAILAALNLNIFARHAERVRMANIAHMMNVLQAMVLTDGGQTLTAPRMDGVNTFEDPEAVSPKAIAAKVQGGKVSPFLAPRPVSVISAEP